MHILVYFKTYKSRNCVAVSFFYANDIYLQVSLFFKSRPDVQISNEYYMMMCSVNNSHFSNDLQYEFCTLTYFIEEKLSTLNFESRKFREMIIKKT